MRTRILCGALTVAALATSPARADETAYVVGFEASPNQSTVDVFNGRTRAISNTGFGTVPNGRASADFSISPAGTLGFFPDFTNNKFRSFVIPGGVSLTSRDGLLNAASSTVSPATGRFLVGHKAQDGTYRVSAVDGATGAVVATSPTLLPTITNTITSVAVAPARVATDGTVTPERGYAADVNGNIVELDTNTLLPTGRTWSVQSISSGEIAIASDGSTLYSATNSSSNVYAVSLAASDTTPVAFSKGDLASVPTSPSDVVVTPSNRRVVAIGYNAGVWIGDATTQTWTRTLTPPGGAHAEAVALTTDGTGAVVPLSNGRIWLIDIATGRTRLNDSGTLASEPNALAFIPQQGPTAAFTATASGATVTVDGNASSDPDGKPVKWTWDFGDGSTAETTTPFAQHAYAASGAYTVRLTVTDDQGNGTDAITDGRRLLRNNSARATTTQTVGVTVPAAPGGGGTGGGGTTPPPGSTPKDTTAPSVTVTAPKRNARIKASKLRTLKGTAADASGVRSVQVSLSRKTGKRCRLLGAGGKLSRKRVACSKTSYRTAKGTTAWKVAVKKLPAGRYTLRVRVTDNAGNLTTTKVAFRVR